LVDELTSIRPDGDLRARAELQLGQDVLHVRGDSRFADHQLLRDASIGVPAPDQGGYFALTRAQMVQHATLRLARVGCERFGDGPIKRQRATIAEGVLRSASESPARRSDLLLEPALNHRREDRLRLLAQNRGRTGQPESPSRLPLRRCKICESDQYEGDSGWLAKLLVDLQTAGQVLIRGREIADGDGSISQARDRDPNATRLVDLLENPEPALDKLAGALVVAPSWAMAPSSTLFSATDTVSPARSNQMVLSPNSASAAWSSP